MRAFPTLRRTFLTTLTVLTLTSACAEDDQVRAPEGVELVPINEADDVDVDLVFDGIRAEVEANGVLALVWDEVVDEDIAFVELWRPDMDKWSELTGGDWNPALDDWGNLVATIPVGPATWVDPSALVLEHNRYIIRTRTWDGEIKHGFVVEARPAQFTFRDAPWADEDTNGVGTHAVDGQYVNVRGDEHEVLFMANMDDLLTTTYASKQVGNHTFLEVIIKSGDHAGERGWIASDYLKHSTLSICADNVQVRTGETLGTVVGTVDKGANAYVISGTIRNTGSHRYFEVSVDGLKGFVATDYLCQRGAVGAGNYDPVLAQRYANEANKGKLGYSVGRCYAYVWQAMIRTRNLVDPWGKAGQVGLGLASAYMFGDWADSHPTELRDIFGLQKIESSAADAPVGSTIVWERGQCGFSAAHGHIEIVVSPNYACSDFCGYMRNNCGNPGVYMPVK